ncbi:MAG: hypothetical protein QM779_02920 [Propionicimonas sp.]|uniref:hypothetical protein n=1 Tax=Propionicimonas sp. TaxID=1955623 RepID=UPI003D0B9025
MDALQITIWVVTLAGLVGLAAVFYTSQRLGVRLAALGVFGAFYLAVLLWGPIDDTWSNVTMISILVATIGPRMARSAGGSGKEGPSRD